MCIIAIKPAGVKPPADTIINTMWTNNSDGAGFMYASNGMLYINKGYLKLKHLKKGLKALKVDQIKTPIIYHFRIGTSGGNTAQNTHPFPICDELEPLRRLNYTCNVGVAHNGVIPIEPGRKDISDTMEYITSQLGPLYNYDKEFYKRPELKTMIYNATHSKLAFMDASGHIETIGKFEKKDGLLFSNYSFNTYRSYYKWDMWDDYGQTSTKWNNEYYSSNYVYRNVQWIENGYIVDAAGKMIDGDSYLIDEDNKLYEYDSEGDFVQCEGTAYNSSGLPFQFDYEQSDFVKVKRRR